MRRISLTLEAIRHCHTHDVRTRHTTVVVGRTHRTVIKLATKAATPATIMTARAKRSPVPLGPSEEATSRRLPIDMTEGEQGTKEAGGNLSECKI